FKLGVSDKFAHAPLRLSAVYSNLFRKASFVDVNDTLLDVDPFTGEDIQGGDNAFDKFKSHSDNFLKHISIGSELLFSDNFHLRLGWNYKARKEMIIDTRPGLVGFSFGVGVNVKKFSLNYSITSSQKGGPSNQINIVAHLSQFKKKTVIGPKEDS
ncbi:MAG: hypothetical protein HRT72_13775, partial [Flavobacteriales bacterium]|nr:hypothetical protein [Flavobacteriales bacterium]